MSGIVNPGGGERVGSIIAWPVSSTPSDCLDCDGSAVSRTTYADLFAVLSTTWGAGDGSTTFNVPNLNSRGLIGSGTGSYSESFADTAINTTTDKITVSSNVDKWITGMVIQWTTTGTRPTGISAATDYYVIRDSATTIQLATSLANAIAGTAIDFSDDGSGTHTIAGSLSARTVGADGGQETHAQKVSELAAHEHTRDSQSTTTGANVNRLVRGGGSSSGAVTSADSTGGGAAFNIMQPYAVVHYVIKF